uniref:Heterogeneous nuclear ribonucleoprotein H2 n=2 Tax=Lygus hesperus TaxID=30085 RepID=A0A0A9YEN4_LYGHE
MGQAKAEDDGCVCKVRGLPWSTTEEDVVKFFSECNIRNGKKGVQMTLSREGRPSGEAYIEMETPEDVDRACKRDRDYMGHRYIEVFRANRSEMDWVVERCGLNMELSRDDACVRLRGLPFDCTSDEIIEFFRGLEVLSNGIIMATDNNGRTTGEAYVQFVDKETAEAALLKHKEKIGHRYIEIFRSSMAEAKLAAAPKMRSGFSMNQRHAPYDRNDRFGGMNRYNNARGMNNRGFRGGGMGGGFNDFDDDPWDQGWDGPRGGGPKPLMGGGGGMDRGFGGSPGGGGGGGGGWQPPSHCIHMRGLPFKATQADIAEFFRPIIPVSIRKLYDDSGRPSGEADVEFSCHDDALKAMAKDKSHMQHRYIELFMDSTPGGGPDRGFSGPPGKLGNRFGGRGGMGMGGGIGVGGGFNRRF